MRSFGRATEISCSGIEPLIVDVLKRNELFAARPSGTVREAANCRIANRRMRTRLGVDLLYPDFTAGLPIALGLRTTRPDSRT